MDHAKPLPGFLVKRYHGWKATEFEESRHWYRRLADEGQRPRTMVISCCDSRVHVTSIFGAETGEFFIHRNIAALIPPYAPDKDYHGTSAAIEYAVQHLKVTNLMVLGHSGCGGVKACSDICLGQAKALEKDSSFIGKWLEILRPGFERLAHDGADVEIGRLEQEAVVLSLENLMTFPFVKDAVEAEKLSLHGLRTIIGDGELEQFRPEIGAFEAV